MAAGIGSFQYELGRLPRLPGTGLQTADGLV